jgi:hypothetical protein
MALQDENRDKAADLLKRTLASSVGTGAPGSGADACPDAETLAAYVERSLDAQEIARYELHFSQCARCRDELAATARAAAPVPRPPRIRWIWTWGWMALAPVTAVLLIAAIFMTRRPYSNHTTLDLHPLVASQAPSEPTMNGANLEAPPPATARIEKAPEQSRIQSSSGFMPRSSSHSATAHLPLQLRDDKELPKLAKPEPQEPSTQTPGGGVLSGDLEQPRGRSETVTVQSQAARATAPAPAPQSSEDNAIGGMGVGPAAAPKKTGPMLMAGAAGGAAVNQMIVVRAPVDRSARTLVHSPDPQVVWRISGGHYVEMSADAGATWRAQWTSPSAHLVAGSAPSAETCWLVGSGGIVLRTTDANIWQTITPPVSADFTSVAAVDAQSATISTTDGRSFQTHDGGKHWTLTP